MKAVSRELHRCEVSRCHETASACIQDAGCDLAVDARAA
jgi:hypothetical protein